MTTREKLDLMAKVNAANEQRIAEYLINGHQITIDSPVTLDIAHCMVNNLQNGHPIYPLMWETLREYAEQEGYDADLIINAVRAAGGLEGGQR